MNTLIKKLFFALFLLGIQSQINATNIHIPTNIQPNCGVMSGLAYCTIINTWANSIHCEALISSKIKSGGWFSGKKNLFIPPGATANIQLSYFSKTDPIVDVIGSAVCNHQPI